MANLSNDQQQTLINEAVETVKGGADLVQYLISLAALHPFKVISIVGLFTIALGGFKLKLSDIVDLKK